MFKSLNPVFKRLAADQKGVTALEYAVIATATIAAILVAMSAIGTNLNTLFTAIGNGI
jgi:Flp pilus assembly pilin Flp